MALALRKITDSGMEFQSSMTRLLKLCALVGRRLLGFSSLSHWPLVMADGAYEKRMSGLIMSIPFRMLYVWIMSPHMRLYLSYGSVCFLSLSSFGISFSSGSALVARRCTASTSIA